MLAKKTGIQSFLLTPRSVRDNIQKQAHLDTLSVFDCEGAGLGEIILLISILKKSHKHLRHLKITIKESMAATEKEFKKLFFELAKLTELEHLDLNLIGCKKITDITVFHLCLQLGNFKQLKTLSLTFSSYYITNKSIVRISKLIAKLKALQNLSLKFIKCFELTKVGANYLLYKLKRAKTLQSLTLAFRECNQIKDVVVDSLANLLPYLKSLVHFHCFFICCGKIVNQTVSKLATQLDHKKTLKTLSFWNESIIQEIKDLTLKKLFSSISRLPHLEEISLNVSVHEETLKYIWDPLYLPLEKLKNLKKLSLHFPNNHRITIAELLKSLNSVVNPQLLQKLILDLSSRPITDEDCISIFHTLKRFQRLQAFKIDLSKCQNITDKGFLSMLESIENVKDVNSLSLSFGRCHQLTDDSICSLPKFLSRYPNLKSIEADFSRCLNIADESIFQLDSLLANQM